MNKVFLPILVAAAVSSGLVPVQAGVEETVVGPVASDAKYVVSPRGGHFGVVVRKGSRVVVEVDGVAGPRFDEILLSLGTVDPRFYADTNGFISKRHGRDQPVRGGYVTFSRDGSRYAYVGRSGTELVLVVDNKEMLREPIEQNGMAGFRLEFSGPSGAHVMLAQSDAMGLALWVDGQKWPGSYVSSIGNAGYTDPVATPDGEHIAYVAQLDRDHRGVIVDGKVMPWAGEDLMMTPDGKHLITRKQSPNGVAVMVDGKPLLTAKVLTAIYAAPVGYRLALVMGHSFPDHSVGQFLLVDGKPVEATACHGSIDKVVFSPDGRHYAALCTESAQVHWVVVDGKKGERYDQMGSAMSLGAGLGLSFTSDSSKVVYLAHGAGKSFVVSGEDESDGFDAFPEYVLSADGAHLAYGGIIENGSVFNLVIDGKAHRLGRMTELDHFDFSTDGSHYAYFADALYVDGKSYPLAISHFVISPDGTHVAALGYRTTDNRLGVWFDGQLVYKNDRPMSSITFSADGQHLYWLATEPATGPGTDPNTTQEVTYCDGKLAARAAMPLPATNFVVPSGYGQFTVHPGWQISGPTGLVWIANGGSDIKRYLITPDGTSLASLTPVK